MLHAASTVAKAPSPRRDDAACGDRSIPLLRRVGGLGMAMAGGLLLVGSQRPGLAAMLLDAVSLDPGLAPLFAHLALLIGVALAFFGSSIARTAPFEEAARQASMHRAIEQLRQWERQSNASLHRRRRRIGATRPPVPRTRRNDVAPGNSGSDWTSGALRWSVPPPAMSDGVEFGSANATRSSASRLRRSSTGFRARERDGSGLVPGSVAFAFLLVPSRYHKSDVNRRVR